MSDTLNSTLHLKIFIYLLLKELEAFLFLIYFCPYFSSSFLKTFGQ